MTDYCLTSTSTSTSTTTTTTAEGGACEVS